MSETGFIHLAEDASRSFRTIMAAMSRPGRILAFSPAIVPPEPLRPTAAAIALNLCDYQTPLWLAPRLATPEVCRYLRFETGAPITDDPGEASYIFADAQDALPCPSDLAQGTHDYPDRSATLVIQTAALSASGPIELSGPGIPHRLRFAAAGVSPAYWSLLADNHAAFPVGIDTVFVSPEAIAALPRSSAIHVAEDR